MINTIKITQQVIDGKLSPFEASYLIKEQINILKTHLEIVNREAQNKSVYENKNFSKDGFKMEKRNGRKLWDFKDCKSYKIAKHNLTEIENDLKANFSMFEKGKSVIDENGEIMEVPLVKYCDDVLIIKKEKNG